MYPMWMNKRSCIAIEIPVPGGGGHGGGSGGGGFTIAHVEKPFPTVKIRKVISMDDYDNINIKIVRLIDLSLSGGGNVDI